MRRENFPNPHYPGYLVCRCTIIDRPEQDEWHKIFPPTPPPGSRYFIRHFSNHMEFGIEPCEPATQAKQASSDKLDGMELPELQELAGRQGVKYDPATNKSELIARIRDRKAELAARFKGKKNEQPPPPIPILPVETDQAIFAAGAV